MIEINFAFDKQYQSTDDNDDQWRLYNYRTREFAKKVGDFVNIYRITDYGSELKYKDAPVDQGEIIFRKLFKNAEPIILNKEFQEKDSRKNIIPYIPKHPDYNFGQIKNNRYDDWDIM